MTGIEVAVCAYLFAWVKRRGKSAAERAGEETDNIFGKLMDRLHRLVEKTLGTGSQPMNLLEQEAREGLEQPSQGTSDLMLMSLRIAAERDEAFAAELADLVIRLNDAETAAGGAAAVAGNTFGDRASVHVGDVGGDVRNEVSGGTNYGTINQGRDMHID